LEEKIPAIAEEPLVAQTTELNAFSEIVESFK
jgi:hypothetical protein